MDIHVHVSGVLLGVELWAPIGALPLTLGGRAGLFLKAASASMCEAFPHPRQCSLVLFLKLGLSRWVLSYYGCDLHLHDGQ